MATIACYSNGRTTYAEESSFNVLTPDDVFDVLEDMIDEIKTFAKQRAPLQISNGYNAEFEAAKICSEELNKMWDKVSNDTAESYYIDSAIYNSLNNYKTVIDAVEAFVNNLLCKGTMEILRFRYTVVPFKFVMEHYVVETKACYMLFMEAPNDKICHVPDMDSYNKCCENINRLNKKCRVFECTECGRISYVDKHTDDKRREKGLPICNKCFNCATRKES